MPLCQSRSPAASNAVERAKQNTQKAGHRKNDKECIVLFKKSRLLCDGPCAGTRKPCIMYLCVSPGYASMSKKVPTNIDIYISHCIILNSFVFLISHFSMQREGNVKPCVIFIRMFVHASVYLIHACIINNPALRLYSGLYGAVIFAQEYMIKFMFCQPIFKLQLR